MVRPARPIQCASNARQRDQGPHRRISIRASDVKHPAQTGGTYESNRSNPLRKNALAKGASTYEPADSVLGDRQRVLSTKPTSQSQKQVTEDR